MAKAEYLAYGEKALGCPRGSFDEPAPRCSFLFTFTILSPLAIVATCGVIVVEKTLELLVGKAL